MEGFDIRGVNIVQQYQIRHPITCMGVSNILVPQPLGQRLGKRERDRERPLGVSVSDIRLTYRKLLILHQTKSNTTSCNLSPTRKCGVLLPEERT